MSIKKCCENCSLDGHCLYKSIETNCIDGHFIPKEEIVRQDERNRIITLLKSDLENFEGLADDCVERKDLHELLQNNALRKYIEETIVLLEKEA